MADNILYIFTVLLGMYAMLDPISHTVMFMSVVKDREPKAQKRIAGKACFFVFIFVSLFVLSGELIFHLFDITLASFQIGGGAIIFFTGLNLLSNKEHFTREELEDIASGETGDDVAISPLGTPLIAGPGVISAAMNFTGLDKSFNLFNILLVIAVLGILCMVNYFCFISYNAITRKLGVGTVRATSKIMAIIIIAIATQMIITGIKSAFGLT